MSNSNYLLEKVKTSYPLPICINCFKSIIQFNSFNKDKDNNRNITIFYHCKNCDKDIFLSLSKYIAQIEEFFNSKKKPCIKKNVILFLFIFFFCAFTNDFLLFYFLILCFGINIYQLATIITHPSIENIDKLIDKRKEIIDNCLETINIKENDKKKLELLYEEVIFNNNNIKKIMQWFYNSFYVINHYKYNKNILLSIYNLTKTINDINSDYVITNILKKDLKNIDKLYENWLFIKLIEEKEVLNEIEIEEKQEIIIERKNNVEGMNIINPSDIKSDSQSNKLFQNTPASLSLFSNNDKEEDKKGSQEIQKNNNNLFSVSFNSDNNKPLFGEDNNNQSELFGSSSKNEINGIFSSKNDTKSCKGLFEYNDKEDNKSKEPNNNLIPNGIRLFGGSCVSNNDNQKLFNFQNNNSYCAEPAVGNILQHNANSNSILLNVSSMYKESNNPSKSVMFERNSRTVYVTNSGSKYHTSGCRYLARSCIPISLDKAKAMYDPCSRCGAVFA